MVCVHGWGIEPDFVPTFGSGVVGNKDTAGGQRPLLGLPSLQSFCDIMSLKLRHA